jgi:hypothetical protein
MFKNVHDALRRSPDIAAFHSSLIAAFVAQFSPQQAEVAMRFAIQVLEVMVGDGWVKAKYDPSKPKLSLNSPRDGAMLHTNRDGGPARRCGWRAGLRRYAGTRMHALATVDGGARAPSRERHPGRRASWTPPARRSGLRDALPT